MMVRGLLCVSLLLAGCAQWGAAQSVDTQPPAGVSVPEIREECRAPSHAAELLGKHGCVAGRVYRVTNTRHGEIRLWLCPGHTKCRFRAVVPVRDSHNVGDVTALRGKVVAVVGDVTEDRDHIAIVVRDRQQLQVTAQDAPPEFDAAQQRPRSRGKQRKSW